MNTMIGFKWKQLSEEERKKFKSSADEHRHKFLRKVKMLTLEDDIETFKIKIQNEVRKLKD